jgi:hypothetical protein
MGKCLFHDRNYMDKMMQAWVTLAKYVWIILPLCITRKQGSHEQQEALLEGLGFLCFIYCYKASNHNMLSACACICHYRTRIIWNTNTKQCNRVPIIHIRKQYLHKWNSFHITSQMKVSFSFKASCLAKKVHSIFKQHWLLNKLQIVKPIVWS